MSRLLVCPFDALQTMPDDDGAQFTMLQGLFSCLLPDLEQVFDEPVHRRGSATQALRRQPHGLH